MDRRKKATNESNRKINQEKYEHKERMKKLQMTFILNGFF